MRVALPLLILCLFTACGGSNTPCTECPDISGRYWITYEAVPAQKSTCGRFWLEYTEEEIVIEQEGSRVRLLPDGWEGTLYDDLDLRFQYSDGETAKGVRMRFRERLHGRIELEPSVRFTGQLDRTIYADSCSLSSAVSWQ